MPTQDDDIVPLSDADKRLEASLNGVKFACSDYIDNPNKKTDSDFSVASAKHAKALQRAGLTKQAGHMTKVDKDFRGAKTKHMKQRIVEVLARSLVSKANPFLWGRVEHMVDLDPGRCGEMLKGLLVELISRLRSSPSLSLKYRS